MLRIALLGAMALALVASIAHAEQSSMCVDIAGPKTAASAHGASWVTLTSEQYHFMQGIYAMAPSTPAGLPFGSTAVLVERKGHDGGLIWFVDGDRICTPLPIPKGLVEMLADVASGAIHHEGSGL